MLLCCVLPSKDCFSAQTGVEQSDDGKRRGRACHGKPRTCQAQPAESSGGTACPPSRRRKIWRGRRRKRKETPASLQHPLDEEDWEKEIREAAPTEDWGDETHDYDPEDLLCNVVQRVTLNSKPCGFERNIYVPALHHVSPIKWVQHVSKTVDDQFIDAEE